MSRLTSAAASTKTPFPSDNDGSEEEFIEDDDIDIDNEEFEDEEENFGMEISTGGTDWGETILSAVQRLLSTDDTLEIYSFRVIAGSKRVDIRLDKLTNKYGSPSLDEVGLFSRNLMIELVALMGEEKAGEIEIEVSSPGAERLVRVPEELKRFGEMPMLVEYDSSSAAAARGGEAKIERKKTVLHFQGVDDEANAPSTGGISRWTLADVRANRSGKGRVLNKKQRETLIEIPIKYILHVNLHVDV
jgi:ribosome maturation factor RimP